MMRSATQFPMVFPWFNLGFFFFFFFFFGGVIRNPDHPSFFNFFFFLGDLKPDHPPARAMGLNTFIYLLFITQTVSTKGFMKNFHHATHCSPQYTEALNVCLLVFFFGGCLSNCLHHKKSKNHKTNSYTLLS